MTKFSLCWLRLWHGLRTSLFRQTDPFVTNKMVNDSGMYFLDLWPSPCFPQRFGVHFAVWQSRFYFLMHFPLSPINSDHGRTRKLSHSQNVFFDGNFRLGGWITKRLSIIAEMFIICQYLMTWMIICELSVCRVQYEGLWTWQHKIGRHHHLDYACFTTTNFTFSLWEITYQNISFETLCPNHFTPKCHSLQNYLNTRQNPW